MMNTKPQLPAFALNTSVHGFANIARASGSSRKFTWTILCAGKVAVQWHYDRLTFIKGWSKPRKATKCVTQLRIQTNRGCFGGYRGMVKIDFPQHFIFRTLWPLQIFSLVDFSGLPIHRLIEKLPRYGEIHGHLDSRLRRQQWIYLFRFCHLGPD